MNEDLEIQQNYQESVREYLEICARVNKLIEAKKREHEQRIE